MPRLPRSTGRGRGLLLRAGLLLAGATLASCGGDERAELPAACRLGAGAVLEALEAAPGEVRLDGATPLSECLVRGSDSADVLLVGGVYLRAATELAGTASDAPDGPAALRLGYLMGAIRRGASHTQGIHGEIVRRLEQETGRIDTDGPAYRRGLRAGRESG